MRRTPRLAALVAIAWSLGMLPDARAATLTRVEDERSVHTYVLLCEGFLCRDPYIDSDDFVHDPLKTGFNADSTLPSAHPVVEAHQYSETSSEGIQATGSVATDPFYAVDGGNGNASSLFHLVFSVDVAAAYTFEGSVYKEVNGYTSSVTLSSSDSGILFTVSSVAPDTTPFAIAGILEPGTYTLDASAVASGFHGSCCGPMSLGAGYDALLLIPEPSTGWLVGGGLVAIAARRAGRRR